MWEIRSIVLGSWDPWLHLIQEKLCGFRLASWRESSPNEVCDGEWVRVRMSGLLNVAKTQPSTPNAFREHFAKCHTNIRTCLSNDNKSKSAQKKKKPRGETRCRNLAIGGHDTRKQTSEPLNKNIQKIKKQQKKRTEQREASYWLASPLPTMGPAVRGVCKWAVFAYECMDLGPRTRSLPPKSLNFQRMSFLDCATCAKSADEWVCVYVWERASAFVCERESQRECVWLTGVCVRQGWMWTHVESHHRNTERSVNTK